MYASSWMFERPFGAMNGCWGGSWPAIGLAVAGAPMNVGTSLANGSWGIGGGVSPGTCAPATAGVPSAATATIAPITARLLIPQKISDDLAGACRLPLATTPMGKNGVDGGPETAGADPGPQPVDEHLHPRLPRRRDRRARLLQRG